MTSELKVPQPRVRDLTFDAAKGISIVLVVMGHALRGLFGADLAEPQGVALALDTWGNSIRMPFFMFLAGLFIVRSVSRVGVWPFIRVRVADLLWVYLVWSVINGLLQVGLNQFTNGNLALSAVFMVWIPQGHMWFLPCLALTTAVVVALRPWSSSRRGKLVLIGAVLLSLGTWTNHFVWPLTWIRPELALFFVAGVLIGGDHLQGILNELTRWRLAAVSAAAFAANGLLLTFGADVPDPAIPQVSGLPTTILGIVAAILGVIGMMCFSALLVRSFRPLAAVLGYLGQRSLAIYVSHTIFTAGARTILLLAGVKLLAVQGLVGLVAGVSGPLLLSNYAYRLHLGLLFQRPRFRTHSTSTGLRDPS